MFLFGTTILIKQTSGIVLSIVFVGYKILEVGKISELKKFIKIFMARLLGVLIPILFFAFYLTYKGIWGEFIDYAVLGIGTFSNSISYITLLNSDDIILKILAYVVPILFVLLFIILILSLVKSKLREKEWVRNSYLLLMYSIGSIVVIFPISEKGHFGIGTMCITIAGIYLLYNMIKYFLNKIKNERIPFGIKTFIEAVSTLVFLLCIFNATYSINVYVAEINDYGKLKHFNYIPIDYNMYERICNVDRFIVDIEKAGREVYIVDAMSAAFSIPIDRYHKDYDMFLIGNIGSKGEKRYNRRSRK